MICWSRSRACFLSRSVELPAVSLRTTCILLGSKPAIHLIALQAPTLQGVDALSDTDATRVLHILSKVHLRSRSASRTLLGHYVTLTPSLLDTLPLHSSHLSIADLAQLLVSCCNLSQPPKASTGGKLHALCHQITASARNQITEVLLPNLSDCLGASGDASTQGTHVAFITHALSRMPADIRQSGIFSTVCGKLRDMGSSALLQLTAAQACSVIVSGAREPQLMPTTTSHLNKLMFPLCIVDSSRIRHFLPPAMQLQLLWALHEIKLKSPDLYQAVSKSADWQNLAKGLTDALLNAVRFLIPTVTVRIHAHRRITPCWAQESQFILVNHSVSQSRVSLHYISLESICPLIPKISPGEP